MTDEKDLSIEDLTRQLIGYIKLSRRPDLSTGARTVLRLQIEHIEHLIKARDGL